MVQVGSTCILGSHVLQVELVEVVAHLNNRVFLSRNYRLIVAP